MASERVDKILDGNREEKGKLADSIADTEKALGVSGDSGSNDGLFAVIGAAAYTALHAIGLKISAPVAIAGHILRQLSGPEPENKSGSRTLSAAAERGGRKPEQPSQQRTPLISATKPDAAVAAAPRQSIFTQKRVTTDNSLLNNDPKKKALWQKLRQDRQDMDAVRVGEKGFNLFDAKRDPNGRRFANANRGGSQFAQDYVNTAEDRAPTPATPGSAPKYGQLTGA